MKRVVPVVATFLLGVGLALALWWPRKPAPAAAPSPIAEPSPWPRVRELLDRNDLEAAGEAVREGLKREPSAEGHALLGLIQHRKRDSVGAISLLDRAQEIDPAHPMTYLYRGQARLARDEWGKARSDFDEFVRLEPGRADGYAWRAAARFYENEFAGAIEDAVQAIGIDPKCADAYFARAASYAALSRLEQALGDYNRCIELKPDHVEAIVNRANLHARRRDLDRAIRDWERAIELEPALKGELQPLIDEAKGR